MTPRDLARALAVTTVIADAAKERKDELRAQLQAALNDLGADSAKADLPDGTIVGKASLAGGTLTPRISNDDLLAAWVEDAHPTEVITTVRESFRKALLSRVVPGPDGTAVDPDTGEVIPGITYQASTAYVSMRFDKAGRVAIIDALRDGTVNLDLTSSSLPALPNGDPA